jgi:Tfp pilus assembly protein PilW
MFPNRKFNRQDGFSMMELLVSLVTMTVVVGASLALIGSSIKFAHSTYNMTDAEQGLRTAHEMINRDLVTAGDGMKGIGKITTPVAFVQNYLTRTPVLSGSDTTHGDVGLVTSDDNVPASIAVPQASPAVNFQTGSDRISMLVKDSTNSRSVRSMRSFPRMPLSAWYPPLIPPPSP